MHFKENKVYFIYTLFFILYKMKLIKILFWLLITLIVFYVLWLFVATDTTRSIGDSLGLEQVNNTILQSKDKLDAASTNISIDSIQDSYKKTIDTAMDAKTQLEDGISTTKENIDNIRSGVQDAKETLESGIETFNETKTQIEETTKKIQDIKEGFEGTLDGENSANQKRIQELKEKYKN